MTEAKQTFNNAMKLAVLNRHIREFALRLQAVDFDSRAYPGLRDHYNTLLL